MNQYVAFLRGMNLGGRRITNDELRAQFEAIGFLSVAAFLASGNIVFETRRRSPAAIATSIEERLRDGLGYEVPTFLRHAREVRAIADVGPFRGERGAEGGKPQIVLLSAAPDDGIRQQVLELATEADRLAFGERELHWLPRAGILTSELDLPLIEKLLGPTTTRTRNTIERLATKFLT